MLRQIILFYSPGEWTALGVIVGTLVAAWRILRPLTKAIWNLVRTWERMSSGFPKLTEEVAAIKELLAQGTDWMTRHDDESKDTVRRVVVLETNVGALDRRTSKLESNL